MLWSQICSSVGVAGTRIWLPCLVVPGLGSIWREGWLHTYKMDTEHFANSNFSVFVTYEMLFFMVCGVRQNFYVLIRTLPQP